MRQQNCNDRSVRRVPTYLPELLTRILSTYPLQDLRATGMLFHKAVQLVYILVDNNVQPLLNCVVLGDLLRCELLGHCDCARRRGGKVWSRLLTDKVLCCTDRA